MSGYIAIDQYGHTHRIQKYPRKELLACLGWSRAHKMYRDTHDGGAQHIGYVIGGLWLSVYRLEDGFPV